MRTHLNPHNILFQQGRKDGSCYAFVLHEVLEHDVVDGISYCHFVIWEYDITVQMYGYFLKLQNKSGKKKKIPADYLNRQVFLMYYSRRRLLHYHLLTILDEHATGNLRYLSALKVVNLTVGSIHTNVLDASHITCSNL